MLGRSAGMGSVSDATTGNAREHRSEDVGVEQRLGGADVQPNGPSSSVPGTLALTLLPDELPIRLPIHTKRGLSRGETTQRNHFGAGGSDSQPDDVTAPSVAQWDQMQHDDIETAGVEDRRSESHDLTISDQRFGSPPGRARLPHSGARSRTPVGDAVVVIRAGVIAVPDSPKRPDEPSTGTACTSSPSSWRLVPR
jgi:hypothetical protein